MLSSNWIEHFKKINTNWCVVTLKKRWENCGAESSGPCGAGKLITNITGLREKDCLECLRNATESFAIKSG
jgi:hypothetical protein